MAQPLHILLMPSWYKTSHEPFLGTFFEEQARALMKRGHRAGILYPAYIPPGGMLAGDREPDRLYDDEGLPTSVAFVQTRIPRSRKLNYKSFARRVDQRLQEYMERYGRPDLIHAHSVFYAGIAAHALAPKHGLPLVITEHLTAYIMGTISNETDRSLAIEIFTGADASLIVSNNFKEDIEKELTLGPDVFRVVHNMVADLFFEDFVAKPYEPKQEPFVLFTNSFLLPRKNHKLIFEALAALQERRLDVHLRVGGDGALRDELRSLAESLGIAHRVEFLGGLTRRQVYEHVRASHAFILASFYETFGVVLIESLACGRPVISTDSGGPRDIIDASNGLLVREFSPGKLADAVETLMNRYGRYDQQGLSAQCHARFNEMKIASELEAVYREVLEKRNA
jgi:glycosyltransferase involved in cell wall biosynthesis